jgi:hypothetical protein
MALKLQLNVQANWSLIYDESRQAQLLSPTGGYIPIPAFEVPFLFDKPVLACRIINSSAKSTWKFGGYLSQRFQIGSGGGVSALPEVDATSLRLRLNRSKLLIFPQYIDTYSLTYEPPTWFKNVQFSLWEYRGTVTDSIEELVNQVGSADLQRIEQKIDDIATYGGN